MIGKAMLAGSLLLLTQPAFAQDPDALALGTRGLGEYEAREWDKCASTFAQAEKLTHSPVFLLYQARCARGGGKLLLARELLDRVAKEEIAKDAPGPFRQARIDAQAELALLERAIPTVKIVVIGAAPGDVTLKIDDKLVSGSGATQVDPGSHRATATLPQPGGALVRETVFEIKEGQVDELVEIRFGESPRDTAPRPPAAPPPEPGATGGPGIVPGAILLGVGGAAAIAGAVLGGIALGGYEELKDEGCSVAGDSLRCAGGTTSEQIDRWESTDALADASTGLVISGGIVAAVGVVLMIALPDGEPVSVRSGRLELRF